MGYPAGTVLRDVTLAEARAMECNRCAQCCDGLDPDIAVDDHYGLPLFVWTRDDHDTAFQLPEDAYEERYGEPLIRPIVRGDGGLAVGKAFEKVGPDGSEHRSFQCSALRYDGDDPETRLGVCTLYGVKPAVRPYHCGSFPVFGMEADQAVAIGGEYIPHTSALPRCTWYGLRIVKEQS